LLDHGHLILTHGDEVGLESRDVGCLTDGVDEEADGHVGIESLLTHLVLDCRIALEPSQTDEVQNSTS
jgi:hypothetical protein